MSVAQLFAETVAAANAHCVFGIVGDSLNSLMASLQANGTIEWVGVWHGRNA